MAMNMRHSYFVSKFVHDPLSWIVDDPIILVCVPTLEI